MSLRSHHIYPYSIRPLFMLHTFEVMSLLKTLQFPSRLNFQFSTQFSYMATLTNGAKIHIGLFRAASLCFCLSTICSEKSVV